MLMLENPSVLEPLLAILVKSPWLAQLLRQHPALLESLCDANGLAQPLEGQSLRQALLQQLQNIPANDQEKQMENLRQFKWSQLFRIAIADLQHRLPLMRVSDHLSDLAIALLEQVERNAWQQVSTRYRLPENLIDHGFAIVAYGKLGGIELSYSSDLDLVFLYQESSATQANKVISSSEFYWKLAQKMLSLLQTKTYSGALYEIDLRLRPSGNAGLLVSELTAYADYQLNQAWTWEHQALLRARMVVGSESMRQQFTLLRRHVLCQPRDPELLRKAVVDMRDKMRISHPETKANVLKQGRGGLIDIEFLVQYLALRYAATYPELIVYPDNIRILEACAKVNVLSAAESAQLIDIYKQLRQLVHYQFMQVPAASDNPEARAAVALLWQKYLA
jgi:glutamate-ammonia-ligase adenylyltransferase